MPDDIQPKDKTEKKSAPGSKRHEFIIKLISKVRQDDAAREVWKNKQVVASHMRLGMRQRRTSGAPYPGYADVPIPVTDKIIKKLKSLYVSVASFSKKQIVVSLEEGLEQPETARVSASKIEKAMNGLVRKRDFKWSKTITLFVDYFLENGHAIFKVIEKFTSKTSNRTINLEERFTPEQLAELKGLKKVEVINFFADTEGLDPENKDDSKALESIFDQVKSGENIITFTRRIVFSEPTVIPERALRIIVPQGTTDLQRAPRITHDMWMTYNELKGKAHNDVYFKSVVDALKDDQGSADDSLTTTSWDIAEGVASQQTRGNSELFNVRECQTWYEENGKATKWVFTWIENHQASSNENGDSQIDENPLILQELKFPYDHGFYTYVKHDNEIKNTRWHSSRGVPEQSRGMHHVMEKMFNARVIRDEYNNNPMFRVSRQLGMSGDEIRFKPGQIIEAEQGEIEQINKAITTDVSSERIEQQAKAYIEEYQSIVDHTVRSAVNQGSSRTATEVNAIRGEAQQQLNTEVAIFLETLSEVAHQMYLILKQSVTSPRVIGGVLLTPQDFEINATVAWIGSLEASDHQLQMNKAMQRIQTLAQFALPTGIMTTSNLYFALKDWLEKDPDVENPDNFITAPQEVLVDQSEDQMNEIVLMQAGFNPTVKPDDQHGTHIDVMEAYLEGVGAQLYQQNQAFAQAFDQHLNIHLEAEKANKQGGDTSDPRRKRVLQQLDPNAG
jgi:hypothetical protein